MPQRALEFIPCTIKPVYVMTSRVASAQNCSNRSASQVRCERDNLVQMKRLICSTCCRSRPVTALPNSFQFPRSYLVRKSRSSGAETTFQAQINSNLFRILFRFIQKFIQICWKIYSFFWSCSDCMAQKKRPQVLR